MKEAALAYQHSEQCALRCKAIVSRSTFNMPFAAECYLTSVLHFKLSKTMAHLCFSQVKTAVIVSQ